MRAPRPRPVGNLPPIIKEAIGVKSVHEGGLNSPGPGLMGRRSYRAQTALVWLDSAPAVREATRQVGKALVEHVSTATPEDLRKYAELNNLILTSPHAIVDWRGRLKGKERTPMIIGFKDGDAVRGLEFGRHRIPLDRAREILKRRLAEE